MAITPKSYPTRGANRNFRTVSLFVERQELQAIEARPEGLVPVFSLSGRDGYIDARQTFLAFRDPTGVQWAEKYLESVEHLNYLLRVNWFRDVWDTWQGELEAIIQSEALVVIHDIAKGTSPAAFQAAKWLASKSWKAGKGRGRPSAEEVKGELKREAAKRGEHADDLARITAGRPNLQVVK